MRPRKVAAPENGALLAKPNLGTLRRLERVLGFPRVEIQRVARLAGTYYQPFPKIEEPRPFQKKFKNVSKIREIDNPTGELKTIQRCIYERILKPIRLPENVLGGIPGRTIKDNAVIHVSGSTLAKIDIRSFFPSITNKHVYHLFRELLNCSPEIASLLTQLTTFRRHLPQGAPTSTPLANLMIVSLDSEIRSESNRTGANYSDWVDDLAFSGKDPRPVVNIAIRVLAAHGFAVSRTKVTVMGPRSLKILTGTRIGKTPHAHPKQHAWVRSGIHKLTVDAVPSEDRERYIRSLAGRIVHISSLEPTKAERLAIKLDLATRGK